MFQQSINLRAESFYGVCIDCDRARLISVTFSFSVFFCLFKKNFCTGPGCNLKGQKFVDFCGSSERFSGFSFLFRFFLIFWVLALACVAFFAGCGVVFD